MKTWIWILCAACALESSRAELPSPLPDAHAHNDYEHPRPLLDALDQGFCSVEADIYLIDGKLLVAHNREDVSPDRTLQRLYLDPLRNRAETNHGRIFPEIPSITLLIDIKSDAASTYAALERVLKPYQAILTEFNHAGIRTNAVTVIVSGNRPREQMTHEPIRLAAYDGRLPDLESRAPVSLIPLISDNWATHFKWRGQGPIPDQDRQKLRSILDTAHKQGRRVRFWGAPDRPEAWGYFRDAGVDLINTDHLAELRRFLTGSTANRPK